MYEKTTATQRKAARNALNRSRRLSDTDKAEPAKGRGARRRALAAALKAAQAEALP